MGNVYSVSQESFLPSDAFFLSEATRNGSLDIVRLFLKKNPALVYATAKDGCTPWHVASSAGQELILRVLIDTTRANAVSNNFSPLSKVINKQNARGQTPLMLACGGGFSVCVRLLLESGSHLLVADGAGRSALHYAALHNGCDGRGNDCVELLLGHMQDQLIRQGPVAAPPAVHANVIRKFADATDMYGRTALHCAAWSGNGRAAHALWAVGADICARTDTDCYESELPCNTGTTPLHFAAMRGNQNIVVLLLAAWHRMVTRPTAPLPRPAFARSPSLCRPLAPGAGPGTGTGTGADGAGSERGTGSGGGLEPQLEGAGGSAEQMAPPSPLQQHQQQQRAKPQQPEQAAAAGKGGGKSADGCGGGGADGSGGGGSGGGAANDHVSPHDQEGQAPSAAEPAAAAEPARASAAGAGADADATRAATADGSVGGDSARNADASLTAAAADGLSRRSSGAGADAAAAEAEAAPLLEAPRPPSPRPPSGDPRLMVDAYGMTPYSIACKRREEHGRMMIELLDPSTDFTAGEDDERDDPDDQATGGGGGASARRRRRGGGGGGALRRQRYTDGGAEGAGGGDGEGEEEGEEEEEEEDSDDSDSESGAAGPLLLWEGVQLIQGLAAEPEAFFKLQATAPLLQPIHEQDDDDRRDAAAGGAAGRGGGGGARASLISLVTGRSSGGSAGAGSGLLGGFGGSLRGGGGRLAALGEEAVPDCFLCPLTCQVFREPVVAADGVTYEREAIERHLKIVPTSPVTKQRLPSTQVYPNTALKRAIEFFWTAQPAPPSEGQRGGTGLLGRR